MSLDNIFEASVYPYVYLFKKKTFQTDFKLEEINLLEYPEKLIGVNDFENSNALIKKIQQKSIFIKDITKTIKRGLAKTKINFNKNGKYNGIKSTQLDKSYICPYGNQRFDYLSKSEEKLKMDEFSKNLFILPRTIS